MYINLLGKIARDEWFRTINLRTYVDLFEDEFLIMPNHLHGIIWLSRDVGAYCNMPLPPNDPQFHSPGVGLGAIIRGYKSAVTKRINLIRGTQGIPVWQRNYYEHIITTDWEYDAIVEYINTNPLNWDMEKKTPGNHPVPRQRWNYGV